MILGLIPARGGSKGVPRKNIRLVSGKPLIAYSIECGLNCPSIDRVVVSTDDSEIADIAKEWGASVPFLRPPELAQDHVPMLPVMQHTINESESYYRQRIDYLVLLDPTGPLRTVEDVETCIDWIRGSNWDAVISGNIAHRNPYFNMAVVENGTARLVMETEGEVGCRQDAPRVYDLNTVVWVYTRDALLNEQARIPKRTRLFVVPVERALDLDTEIDFRVLETIMDQRPIHR